MVLRTPEEDVGLTVKFNRLGASNFFLDRLRRYITHSVTMRLTFLSDSMRICSSMNSLRAHLSLIYSSLTSYPNLDVFIYLQPSHSTASYAQDTIPANC